MPLAPGSRLGPHEIVAPIGAGGMGEVYKARDTRLDRTVAIKVLPDHLSRNAEARQRLEREARAVSDLNHPHICTLHDIGREGDVDYLVMEYLEGSTLAERLSRGPLPLEDALACATQIAEALDAAHSKGLVHRDLKPGNIMMTRSGAKLLDFGLARASLAGAGGGADMTATPTMTSPLTAQGSIVGTFQYMSPEQLEGKEADARSDIFAFGAVLYEMLTGRRAFSGESQASLIASILKEDPRPVSSLAPVTPKALDRLLKRCFAKRPEERWQSIRDVALDLRWIGENRSEADEADEAVAAPRRLFAWIPWTVAAAAIVAAGLLAVRGTAPTGGPAEPRRLTITVPGPTSFEDLEGASPAVSSDGRMVMFGVKDPGGVNRLWVRRLDEFSARPLPSTTGVQYAFWSPDGRQIAFFAGGQISRIELATNRVQMVAPAGYARGASWSRDGKILFVPNSNTGIHLVNAVGGPVRMLTEPDPNVPDHSHRWPVFLPDGEHFLFVSWTNDLRSRQEHGGVFVASISGGEPPRLVLPDASSVAFVEPGYLLVVRGQNLVAVPFDPGTLQVTGDAAVIAEDVLWNPGTGLGAFSSSDEGTLVYASGTLRLESDLIWHDRDGKASGSIGVKAQYFDLELAPDGSRAAAAIYGEETGTGEIWVVDLERAVRTRLAAGAWYNERPIWSADGRLVMYGSQETGSIDFYTRPADGSGREEPFYPSGKDKELYDWSRDGRYVAFWNAEDWSASPSIWIYSIEHQKAEPMISGKASYREARFSHDGRWIAYITNESGRDEVFVQAFSGMTEAGVTRGGRWQVSTSGGTGPHWRDDGREIVYIDPELRVMAVSMTPGPEGMRVGHPEPLFSIPGTLAAFDATGDHGRFLVSTRDEAASEPLHVVLNWTADLVRP